MLVNSLGNKKIIISGGASGIGWATAKTCISIGAKVFICDISLYLLIFIFNITLTSTGNNKKKQQHL